ncbi:hypothetical protein GCM10011371_11810 [Novosphingobium marinum]|uniref:Alpha-1,4-glucan:maltose-1-phosphate maltosyltransferase n=1 Tax=Novosphingobium marinum TaxID=1514948 RepID=A0A7Y9XVK8_9SPHN|nr:alpha-1,4-glucan--maltose-1-phosphate maltosyltransferase [Novosphingobium marinum]NYH95290.1 starch synthase (maltosyl-transferring) [Novosphingobium marinum]GGC25854.1 hypothetical protein GCM10011371_11810 [Novosphingobium marinum]
MTDPTLRLLSFDPRTSGPDPAKDLVSRAADIGFDGLLVRGAFSPFDMSLGDLEAIGKACRKKKLRLVVEIDASRFPLDHPAVDEHPSAFAIRRESGTDGPVDPRTAMPATGEALARLHHADAAATLEDIVGSRLEALAKSCHIGGFRLSRAERIDPMLAARIAARLRNLDPGFVLIAGPFGDRRSAARPLAQAGIDYLVSSYAWWDGHASWLVDEMEELRHAAPVLCEVSDRSGEAETALVLVGAALGSGLIVPAEMGGGADAFAGRLREAAQIGEKSRGFDGEIRRLSGAGGAIGTWLVGGGPDLRTCDDALVVFANLSGEPQPAPRMAHLSQVGATFAALEPLSGEGGGDPEFDPYEVRLFTARRHDAIMPPARRKPVAAKAFAENSPRFVIESVSPFVSGGDFPAKRVVGDRIDVEAVAFGDGHEQLAAELRWRPVDAKGWSSMRMAQHPNDRWTGAFTLDRLGRWEFEVEAWLDRFGGFRRDFRKKLDAGVAQPVDHAEGALLVDEAAVRSKGKLKTALQKHHAAISRAEGEESAALLLSADLHELMMAADHRPHSVTSKPQLVDAERIEARFSSWYEIFPRSMTDDKARHGTFDDVVAHLPRIRDMGFDTLYFPPIHPIGKTNRKGPNNTLTPGPDDPGSPYAIGSPDGGHDAIHPELGSFEDFGRLVAAAHDHGLEIALDFAIQASPDHPWLKEHPGWFAWRPDGSMKYAENPPKKYQDIVNVDFYGPDAVPGLWEALRDVVLLWAEHGVKTFRVDNPHTKPLPFWEWMIGEVRARHPDAIFLSEAFTRPTMMYRLAKVGFSQSYTYFTWRDRKHELVEYITELTTQAPKEFYRPHFFVNTPDINPHFLQTGGRPAHRIRAVLAATLSGLWGVYSGFELCDAAPLGPGKEEYLDSEKYEIRVRDWHSPGNIIADVTMLNRLRKAHPALQTHLNTRFYTAHNENVIWYGKPAPDGSDLIMVMVNMDPHNAHECDYEVPLWQFGLGDDASIAVEDLANGNRFELTGKWQHTRLSPDEPYRIWRFIAPEGRKWEAPA